MVDTGCWLLIPRPDSSDYLTFKFPVSHVFFVSGVCEVLSEIKQVSDNFSWTWKFRINTNPALKLAEIVLIPFSSNFENYAPVKKLSYSKYFM